MTVPCCTDPRNITDTYDKGYVSCTRCHRRWDFSTRYGWQPDPRPGKGKWQ